MATTIPAVQVEKKGNQKIKFIVGGVIIVLAVIYLIYTGIQSTASYFLTVEELHAKGETIHNRHVRVSGHVDAATIDYNSRDLILQFEITGETGERLPVIFNGPRPDQMQQDAEAILEGKYNGEIFTAQSLLMKCPSRYEEGSAEEVQAVR